MEALPKPPAWKSREVLVPGGTSRKKSTLFYRDGLECFEFLFGNPAFRDKMQYQPTQVWTSGDNEERLYSEIMTGDLCWRTQVSKYL